METALQLAGTTTMVRAGSNRPTVLIVEPSPAVRRAARLALFHAGYDCRESADADGALRFLHDQRPDLVVTGVAMDGPCDGIGLCAIIRSRSGLQHCPVVVLSGRSDPDRLRRIDEAGASAVLPRMFTLQMLQAAVAGARATSAAPPSPAGSECCGPSLRFLTITESREPRP